MHLPDMAEFLSAAPVILSLVLIEGLLSVDNAMGIAAMAANLPAHQQKSALRWGIVGAYVLRGVALLLASWIAGNEWLKAFGALYLLYLMVSGLVGEEGDDEADAHHAAHARRGFVATIAAIEFMDLTLSLDNVVAAVALDKRMWVVCLGVFFGILTMRFVAGYCIKLMARFPILQKTAFLLIGWVGVILSVELGCAAYGIEVEITALHKFVGIVLILGATLLYSETAYGKGLFGPVVRVGMPIVHAANWLMGAFIFDPVKAALSGYFTTLGKPLVRIYRVIRREEEEYTQKTETDGGV